jgi:TRAP-type C4-dicarboxylate transport system substrate-binding protein
MMYSHRRTCLVILTALILLVLAVASCAKPAPSATPSPTPASTPKPTPSPTPSPTTAAAPIKLKFTQWNPETVPFGQCASWIVKEWEKRSNGRVKVDYYFNATLASGEQTLKALSTGVADVGSITPSYDVGVINVGCSGELPVVMRDTWSGTMAWHDIIKTPEFQNEFTKLNLVIFSGAGSAPHNIWSRVPIKTLADLKGKKLKALGDMGAVLTAFGATPITMTTPDMYPALERGTIDGGHGGPAYTVSYKLHEVGKYFYMLPLGAKIMPICFNKTSWDKIPKNLQDLLFSLQEAQAKFNYDVYDAADAAAVKVMKAAGVQFFDPSAADVAELKKLTQEKIWSAWVDRINKLGLNGQKILDNWVKLNEDYQKTYPKK